MAERESRTQFYLRAASREERRGNQRVAQALRLMAADARPLSHAIDALVAGSESSREVA